MLMSIQKVLYYLQYFYAFLLWKICARMACFNSDQALDRVAFASREHFGCLIMFCFGWTDKSRARCCE